MDKLAHQGVAGTVTLPSPALVGDTLDFSFSGIKTAALNYINSATQKGEDIAKRMYERHCIIAEALMRLGVSQETALNDACKIEHTISDESFAAIKRFIDEKSSS